MARLFDPGSQRLAGDLPDRLDEPERAAGRTGLADRQLAARRIVGKAAVDFETVAANEVRTFAFAAEAEILELHDADNRIIVIDLDQVDVRRPDARGSVKIIPVHHPAAAMLDRIVGQGVVPFDGAGEPRVRQAQTPCATLAHYETCVGARARHAPVEQATRIGDEAGAV